MYWRPEATETRGGATEDLDGNGAHAAALFMLEAFASVGATKFDITLTTCNGQKQTYQRAVPIGRLTTNMPGILDRASNQQLNVIIRPGPPPVFLQLDDLDGTTTDELEQVSFLTLETSPSSFQAWIAMPYVDDKDFARRLKKGVGADPSASGATRIAGSFNFKTKYAPEFPRVAIRHANIGLTVTMDDLEAQPKSHFWPAFQIATATCGIMGVYGRITCVMTRMGLAASLSTCSLYYRQDM